MGSPQSSLYTSCRITLSLIGMCSRTLMTWCNSALMIAVLEVVSMWTPSCKPPGGLASMLPLTSAWKFYELSSRVKWSHRKVPIQPRLCASPGRARYVGISKMLTSLSLPVCRLRSGRLAFVLQLLNCEEASLCLLLTLCAGYWLVVDFCIPKPTSCQGLHMLPAVMSCGVSDCMLLAPGKLAGARPGTCRGSPLHVCRSEHIVKGILGLQKPDGYGWDMCDNGQCPTVYGPRLPMQERWCRQGERCKRCGNLRFRKRGRQIQPARRYGSLAMYVFELACPLMSQQ